MRGSAAAGTGGLRAGIQASVCDARLRGVANGAFVPVERVPAQLQPVGGSRGHEGHALFQPVREGVVRCKVVCIRQ